MIAFHQIHQSCLGDRSDRILEYGDLRLALAPTSPVLELGAMHQVARLGKRRHPASVDQHGIPAHVVDVKMRAQHNIDALGRITGGGEILKECPLAKIPRRHVAILLVVAEPRVDQNAARRRLDDERVDAQLETAVLVGEMRIKPIDCPNFLARRLRQDEPGAADRLELDHLGDGERAYVPLHPASPICNVRGHIGRHAISGSAGRTAIRRAHYRPPLRSSRVALQ